jgi:hypothetical protein
MTSVVPAPNNKKKRKADNNGSAIKKHSDNNSSTSSTLFSDVADYSPLSLQDMQVRILELCHALPTTLPVREHHDSIVAWASAMQAVIIECNLLLSCIAAATYKWGSERSGAADQNLNVLSAELGNAQDQINAAVQPRLTNVLAPSVDLVVDKVVTTVGEDGKEIKQNYYIHEPVDPAYMTLCDDVLCRNARLLRQVVLANFQKIHTCIGDYLKVTMKDSQHDSRGFSY